MCRPFFLTIYKVISYGLKIKGRDAFIKTVLPPSGSISGIHPTALITYYWYALICGGQFLKGEKG